MEDVDPVAQQILWSMIDYGTLGSDPNKKPLTSRTGISNLSSPVSWALGSGIMGTGSPPFGHDNAGIFGGLTPTMRLNEVEHLLNCSPGGNRII
jgi:hypothetical protein